MTVSVVGYRRTPKLKFPRLKNHSRQRANLNIVVQASLTARNSACIIFTLSDHSASFVRNSLPV